MLQKNKSGVLKKDWIIDGHIDFEYKKYLLLAYLQKIDKSFMESKLYPFYSNIIEHYSDLLRLRGDQRDMLEAFPKELVGFDLDEGTGTYATNQRFSNTIEELNSILEYAIPKLGSYVDEGKGIYEFVKEQMTIFPIGLVPLYLKEGYLLLSDLRESNTQVFRYSTNVLEYTETEYGAVRTHYVTTYSNSISCTYESIKSDLLSKDTSLPNPATYVVESEIGFPLQETFLPVASRILVNYVTP